MVASTKPKGIACAIPLLFLFNFLNGQGLGGSRCGSVTFAF